jgi:CRISPR type III-B/RAMP module RAMP protein Cmr6
MSDQYYLPPETAQRLTPDRLQLCKNLGLILDKYPPQTAIEKSEGKSNWLKGFTSNNHIDPQLVENVSKRWQRALKEMHAQHFIATTQWRMVVGLGGETVLETDLTLHHLYGIPFIPGSALKGLTRAYVTGEEKDHKSKKIEDDDIDMQRIFGTQKKAGSVIFFDAMPVNGKIKIDLDIMNAHYPKYYGEKLPPANDQDPNPVTFLTITDTTFLFAVAPRRPGDTEDVALAIGWLQDAVQKYGVGGKTSAGYGYFTILEQQKDIVASPEPAVPYVRPNIPTFIAGQSIAGSVIATTDELHRRAHEAKAFLRYREFSTQDVLIIVEAEEATNWTLGNTKNCLFVREEVSEGCTVLVCQPGATKKKNNKKG